MAFITFSFFLFLMAIVEKRFFFNISIFITGLYFSCTYGYGYDWINYRETYIWLDSGNYDKFFIEPGITLAMSAFKFFGLPFEAFIFSCSAFMYYSTYRFCRDLKNPNLAFFTIFSFLGFFLFSEWIRQGLAIAIVMLGMCKLRLGGRGLFFICAVIASFFHISAICTLVYFVINKNTKRSMYLSITTGSALLFFLLFSLYNPVVFSIIPIIGDKISAYAKLMSETSIDPIMFIVTSRIVYIYILLFVVFFFLRKRGDIYGAVSSSFFLLISRMSPVLIRIGYLFVPAFVQSVDDYMEKKGRGLKTKLQKLIYILIILMISTIPYFSSYMSSAMQLGVSILSDNKEIQRSIYEKCAIINMESDTHTIFTCK
ncbi:EpsG family protein [Klebsiella quasipneumoniae]|uniref:EpsG family protein n=1 Tax=Klebsiella quasipneumoniae TaxID=1463165 RepID=UPI0034D7808D